MVYLLGALTVFSAILVIVNIRESRRHSKNCRMFYEQLIARRAECENWEFMFDDLSRERFELLERYLKLDEENSKISWDYAMLEGDVNRIKEKLPADVYTFLIGGELDSTAD